MDGAITVAEVIIMDGAEAEATITDGIIAIGDCRTHATICAYIASYLASAAVSDRAASIATWPSKSKGHPAHPSREQGMGLAPPPSHPGNQLLSRQA
jgi:hypothetical protein